MTIDGNMSKDYEHTPMAGISNQKIQPKPHIPQQFMTIGLIQRVIWTILVKTGQLVDDLNYYSGFRPEWLIHDIFFVLSPYPARYTAPFWTETTILPQPREMG